MDIDGNFDIKNGTYQKGELRTWQHISEQNDKWLEETGGDRKKLKNYFNCEFKPIQIKNGREWEEVIKTFPPDPLHCNLLGPVNSCLEIIESLWKEYMDLKLRGNWALMAISRKL